jgi:uncharacterized protein (DUF58 family)
MSESVNGVRWERLSVGSVPYLLSVLAALSFVGGLFLQEPLMFISIPAMTAVGLIVLRSKDPRGMVDVTRVIERIRIREGESTRVRLTVRNHGSSSISMLQIADHIPPELRGRNTNSGFTVTLSPGESKDTYYEITASVFGVYEIGPITLTAQDSVGVFGSRGGVRSYAEVFVFPETTEKLTHFSIRPRKTKSWPGEIVARRTGTGMDYHNIRQFMPGDSVKRINWRASARVVQPSDSLLVNEYAAEVGADVLIIVDAGGLSDSASGSESIFRFTAKAAISIAERLIRDRNRVGLLTTGMNPTRIPPGSGKRQFERIALSLLRLKPGESDIRWWVERSMNLFFPNVYQVIFVSALASSNSASAAAEIARYSNRDVIIVSPNPVEFSLSRSKERNSREQRIAKKLAQIERRIKMERLSRRNVVVVDWTTSASLEEVLEVHRRAMTRHAAISTRHG